MIITDLEPLTKTKVKVFIDEAFAFVLTKADLYSLGLLKGSFIEEDLYIYITDELLLKRAKLKALNLLKARDYTESGLRDKLKADGYPPFLIDKTIDYVKSYNYINDARFIENFCRLNKDTMSRQMLIFKLRQKGISSELINDYMSQLEIDSKPQILRLIQGKCGSDIPAYLSDNKNRQKITAFLLRKGYSYSEIKEAVKAAEENI